METQYETTQLTRQHPHQQQQISTKTMLYATVAGVTIGGPLLAMMGFSFLATMALFVVSSPLLIIFSPVLAGAVFVFVAALVGFGASGVMAIAGLSALGWVLRSVKGGWWQQQQRLESAAGKLVESGENVKVEVKDTGKEWASHLKQTVQESPENKPANRA